MKTSLELFRHAIEHYVAAEKDAEGQEHNSRLAVLHLAHAIELAAKACLLNHNHDIYRKSGVTLNSHEAFQGLKKVWGIPDAENVPHNARVQLLIDERNGIQHRYGAVDAITMKYHMETGFAFMGEVLSREYDVDLDAHLHEQLPPEIVRACALIGPAETAEDAPAEEGHALSKADATRFGYLNIVDGLERRVDEAAKRLIVEYGGEAYSRWSSGTSYLALVLKFILLKADGHPDSEVLAKALRVLNVKRNRVMHAGALDVDEGLGALAKAADKIHAIIGAMPAEFEKVIRDSIEGSIRKHMRESAGPDAGTPPPTED
jgi:hypothetical protein